MIIYKHITHPAVPVDALRLHEDACAIKRAIDLLKSVDPYNISDEPDKDKLWLVIQRLKEMQRYAEQKLRREYFSKRERTTKQTYSHEKKF